MSRLTNAPDPIGSRVERAPKLIERHWLRQNRDRALIAQVFRSPARNENDARVWIVSQNVAAGGRAVKFRHPIIHDHDIGVMAGVSLNRLQPGTYDLHDMVLTLADQLRQRRAYAFLVVRYQHPHD